MAQITAPDLQVGRIVGEAPASGVVAALNNASAVVNLVAWDPATGDTTWSAPTGSGGNTRRHLLDRPVVSSAAGTFVGLTSSSGLAVSSGTSALQAITGTTLNLSGTATLQAVVATSTNVGATDRAVTQSVGSSGAGVRMIALDSTLATRRPVFLDSSYIVLETGGFARVTVTDTEVGVSVPVASTAGYIGSTDRVTIASVGIAGDGTRLMSLNNALSTRRTMYIDGADLRLESGGFERARVASGGQFLVGTTVVTGLAAGATHLGGGVRMSALPTSAAGLSAGDVWNDSGTLKLA